MGDFRFPFDPYTLGDLLWRAVNGDRAAFDQWVALTSDNSRALEDHVPTAAMTSARVRRTTDQSTSNATLTDITFDAARWDDGGYWDSGTPEQLTVPSDGLYLFTAHVEWDNNSTGKRVVLIELNDATVISVTEHGAAGAGTQSTNQTTSTVWRCTAGDYAKVVVRQYSGGALAVKALSAYSPEFTVTRLAD